MNSNQPGIPAEYTVYRVRRARDRDVTFSARKIVKCMCDDTFDVINLYQLKDGRYLTVTHPDTDEDPELKTWILEELVAHAETHAWWWPVAKAAAFDAGRRDLITFDLDDLDLD